MSMQNVLPNPLRSPVEQPKNTETAEHHLVDSSEIHCTLPYNNDPMLDAETSCLIAPSFLSMF